MKIRLATRLDCKALALISVRSFDSYDTMVKMGEGFLERCFFEHVCSSPDSFCLVADTGGEINGYVCAMIDFRKFSSTFRRQYFLPSGLMISKNVLSGKFSLHDVMNFTIAQNRITQSAPCLSQWGPICLSPDLKSNAQGGVVMLALAKESFKLLRKRGIKTIWTVADDRNKTSQSFMKLLKFQEVKKATMFGKTDTILSYQIPTFYSQ